ncbi:inositol 5-phosphatase [Ascosphaera apis ARSEF 7405]|uniref:Inositol 5-phosphatase n=1 Tax=Ascosphaera apis ARSEF 7405 TaxID=392613 RepID=A0A167UWB4_9EURO|nr:inositol 5-phosphatase [Ascosphaera apis ARSEF 7405]
MKSIDVYVVTFNCGRERVIPEEFGPALFGVLPQDYQKDASATTKAGQGQATSSDPKPILETYPHLLVLSLQELAPIAYSYLGGRFLTHYFDGLREAVTLATNGEHVYENAVCENTGMTAIMRRNEDWKKLARLMVFSNPKSREAGGEETRGAEEEEAPLLQLPQNTRGLYSPQSYLFVAGDFNYRTASLGPKPDDYDTFPQPTEDPDSPLHYRHLLSRDQLTRERTNQRTFHHLTEMPITFPPTYKIIHFPEGTPNIVHKAYNWARNRWPSWCDRVLYADASVYSGFQGLNPRSYHSLPVMSTSDHLPVAFLASVALKEIPAPEEGNNYQPPFDIDATWKDRRAAARRKEILSGLLFYLGLTREGNVLFLMMTFILGTLYRILG